MTAWDEVRPLIGTGDLTALVARLKTLDEAGRREVARELPGHIAVAKERAQRALLDYGARTARIREMRLTEVQRRYDTGQISERHLEEARAQIWMHDDSKRAREADGWKEPMRVAGAGVIGGAAAVATWISRREFESSVRSISRRGPEFGPLLDVISSRPASWQADLATRLALRIRSRSRLNPGDLDLRLAFALLRHTGATPPPHDPLVVRWVSGEALPSELRTDPLLDHLLPRIFEAEGVGRALRDERADPLSPASWLGALHKLASEGRVDRALLLGGCRRRFLLGGEGPDLRFFVRLHEVLQPTTAEIEPYAIDYLRLLPAAPGPVAELALRHLRQLTGLDPADVAEALEGLLFRAESGLVRAGLSWLDESVRRVPDRADDYAPALAVAFGHDAPAVRERAVRLAVRRARLFTPLGAEILRDAMGGLTPGLFNRLATVFGGEVVEEPGPEKGPEPDEEAVPPPLPAPTGPTAALPPPTSVRHLADMFLEDDWPTAERSLAAFVQFAASDREALRDALGPLVERHARSLGADEWRGHGDWMIAFAAELAPPRPTFDITNFLHSLIAEVWRGQVSQPAAKEGADRLPSPRRASPLHRFILFRYAEILTALRAGTLPPLLLATPSDSSGRLDPAELVSRLETLEAAGAAPLPADFAQALLRLPRRIDPDVIGRAERLRSEEGRRAARWMADGGLPDPVVRVTRSGADDGLGAHVWMACSVEAAPTGLPLIDDLLADQPRHVHPVCDGHLGGLMEWWPAVLPAHREVVAAHLIGHQPINIFGTHMLRPSSLEGLAAADGPCGRAVAVLLAHEIFPRDYGDHDTARPLRALRRLAAADAFPAGEFGVELSQRVLRGEITLRLLVDTLQAEAENGAYRQMWRSLITVLSALLPAMGGRPTGAQIDLVALAVRLARWSQARGEIPEVSAFAARKGSGRILRHARALHDQLVS
ncbi:hypothetical protein [Microtetraspora malaysiensis]|uniref:DUF7824 domain-containing protein n=1 Tax=Microtetraspora malaysiensis TaxID=161358 RepID=UPI003D92D7B3